ncbi:ParA family protein [Kitasatospora sp. NPDC098652]|uniref:ParA family protein n=1 Tax=Kitasatospora sp. NPDC098652 TaxID=3364095 RepID=UPI003810B011
MARRIAFGKNKGGTGCTTNVVRLAEALAKAGHRVGVADMDPQGNASRRLGWVDSPDKLTVAEAIEASADGVASQVWQPIGWDAPFAERITLLPARIELENRAREVAQRGAYRRFAKALKGADSHLDYLLIDCQPAFGHLTEMAMAAAHFAVGTTEAKYDAIQGMLRWREFVESAGEDLGNPDVAFAGVIVSSYDQRLTAHSGQLANCRKLFGEHVWGVVPSRTTLLNADEYALPLDQVAGSGEVRAVYELLAQHLVKEIPA